MTKDKISLIFTGDIGFDKYMEGKWHDPDLISDEILSFLHEGDHVVVNVEGPFIDRKETSSSGVAQLIHGNDPKAVSVLDKMGADIWNLCNNHIMDGGPEGLQATLEAANEHHALTMGAGINAEQASRVVYLDEGGGIGLFACGFPKGCKPAGEDKAGTLLWNNDAVIKDNIRAIKAKGYLCIMVIHGGEEFTALPSPYVRERYLSFLATGADIIVGHHPHVPNSYETVGDKVIFYSLGNFLFDTDYQRAQYNTDKGIVLKIDVTPDGYKWRAAGITIDRRNEHVVKSDLPAIFTDVNAAEYELLSPLAARVFVENTKRREIYVNPSAAVYDEEDWQKHFADPARPGRIPGELLDFLSIWPLAQKAETGTWRKSKLFGVKKYMLDQL